MKKLIVILLFVATVSASLLLGYNEGRKVTVEKYKDIQRNTAAEIQFFTSVVFEFEKQVTSNIPIYEDFASPAIEAELRTYLYPYHRTVAESYGHEIADDEAILKLVSEGKLVELKPTDSFYFYGVPKKYRYCTPQTKAVLLRVSEEFQKRLSGYGISGALVKFAVSSAVRPAQYQKSLRLSNSNAINESTHSYGVSFDLFFDDYYVSFPENYNENAASYLNKLRPRIGYMLGDSLRRQFHAVLAQTILELQREGDIIAIYERRQKVYHITFTKSFAENL